MSSIIHQTAIISPDASIADGVEIGAFSIVEGRVSIGAGSIIHSHVHLLGDVSIGDNCAIWPGSIIGGDPQSIGFDPKTKSSVVIGAGNTLRENITVHRSLEEGGETILGENNFLMAGAHVGHDCLLGDHNILANNALLGGHVAMGDHCFLGGHTAAHQFVRIGDLAMFRGLAGTSLDIPPYLVVADINNIVGLNSVGMRRAGLSPADRREIKHAYRLFYRQNLNRQQALETADKESWNDPAKVFIDFLRQKSKVGYCMRSK